MSTLPTREMDPPPGGACPLPVPMADQPLPHSRPPLLLGAGILGRDPSAWTVLIGMLPLPLLHRDCPNRLPLLGGRGGPCIPGNGLDRLAKRQHPGRHHARREHEAMDRRMRRCRSTLLLSRDDGDDVDHLFRTLESVLAAPDMDRHASAALGRDGHPPAPRVHRARPG